MDVIYLLMVNRTHLRCKLSKIFNMEPDQQVIGPRFSELTWVGWALAAHLFSFLRPDFFAPLILITHLGPICLHVIKYIGIQSQVRSNNYYEIHLYRFLQCLSQERYSAHHQGKNQVDKWTYGSSKCCLDSWQPFYTIADLYQFGIKKQTFSLAFQFICFLPTIMLHVALRLFNFLGPNFLPY